MYWYAKYSSIVQVRRSKVVGRKYEFSHGIMNDLKSTPQQVTNLNEEKYLRGRQL